MAIQMISDLPVFQITKDTPSEKILGSFMEISYLSSDANSGDNQTRYKSMAIPLGTLYRAIMMSNSSGTGSMYVFPEECTFMEGFKLSGDIEINNAVTNNQHKLLLNMSQVDLSASQININSSSPTIYSKGLELVDAQDRTTILLQDSKRLQFKSGTTVQFEGYVTCGDTDGSNANAVVNYNTLVNQLEKFTGTNGVMFELRQLDYQNDELSSMGWIRLNSNQWLSASMFPKTYSHLSSEYNDSVSQQKTDTYSDINVIYKRAKDGHKIIKKVEGDTSEDIRNQVMNSTGCFWYYTIDTVNKLFRLPMTTVFLQPVGRTEDFQVGNYVRPALPVPPEHQHTFDAAISEEKSVFQAGESKMQSPTPKQGLKTQFSSSSDWKTENSIYSTETSTVQPPAVLMETYMRCM